MTFKFDGIYLYDSFVIAGIDEGLGPIGSYFDFIKGFKHECYEDYEISALYQSIDMLLEKNKLKIEDIDIALSGELSNQLATTYYAYRTLNIPVIGVYSACSSIALLLGLGSLLLKDENINNILVSTSSDTESAEREFRNPNEYGGEKETTQTFTSTIAASAILTNKRSSIAIKEFTLGKIVDVGFTDAMDFGRAMSPAAIETLLEHFEKTNTTPKDYDLILTGDLSSVGYKIVQKELDEKFGCVNNYNDCGLILYDTEKQNVFAGGSGPGTSAGVMLAYIKKQILDKKLNKVLLCATGALMNPTMILQKNSIPCVAHIIVLEGEK